MQKSSINKISPWQKFGAIAVFLILVIYSITLLYPLVWSLFSSFKDIIDYTLNPFGMPKEWFGSNYLDVFTYMKKQVITSTEIKYVGVLGMFCNSFVFSGLGALLAVLVPTLTAYTITKYKFVGRNLLYSVAIVIMILPIVGSLPSSLRIMDAIGFKDNLLGVLIMMSGGFGFNFLLLCATFRSLSWGYAEAAFIDGASHFKVFRSIMLPLVKPTLFALFILSFIGSWNDYMTPLVYLSTMPTLSLGVFEFQFDALSKGLGTPQILAGFVLAMLPILVIFICFQKIIMKNTTAGGLKG